MSEMVLTLAAGAEIRPPRGTVKTAGSGKGVDTNALMETVPAHRFPPRGDQSSSSTQSSQVPAEEAIDLERSYEERRQKRIYRGRTTAMLRRYMRYSIETGRLPSLLGREFFRAKVTAYRLVTFEDRVIFVHDMETCLHRLDDFSQRVLARIVLQEYEHEDAARLLRCTRMTVHRVLLEALDELSAILVGVGLMDAVPGNSCQGGKSGPFSVSDCIEGK